MNYFPARTCTVKLRSNLRATYSSWYEVFTRDVYHTV